MLQHGFKAKFSASLPFDACDDAAEPRVLLQHLLLVHNDEEGLAQIFTV